MDNKLKDVKTFLKKSPEELQEYMAFQRRGSVVPSKKVGAATLEKRNIKIKRKNNMRHWRNWQRPSLPSWWWQFESAMPLHGQ